MIRCENMIVKLNRDEPQLLDAETAKSKVSWRCGSTAQPIQGASSSDDADTAAHRPSACESEVGSRTRRRVRRSERAIGVGHMVRDPTLGRASAAATPATRSALPWG